MCFDSQVVFSSFLFVFLDGPTLDRLAPAQSKRSCSCSSRPRTRYGLLASVGTFLAPLPSNFVQHFLNLDLEHMPPPPPTHTTPQGGGRARPPPITQGARGGCDHTLRGGGGGRPAPNHIFSTFLTLFFTEGTMHVSSCTQQNEISCHRRNSRTRNPQD